MYVLLNSMVNKSKIKTTFRDANQMSNKDVTLERDEDETLNCEVLRLKSDMVKAELLCFEDGDAVLEIKWKEDDNSWSDEKLSVPEEVDKFEVYQEESDTVRMVVNFNDYGF